MYVSTSTTTLVACAGRSAAFAPQDSPEGIEVGAALALGKVRGRAHHGQLLGHRCRDELVHADPFFASQLLGRQT